LRIEFTQRIHFDARNSLAEQIHIVARLLLTV